MSDIDFNLQTVTDEDGDLVYPIVYWRGRLSVFARPSDGEFPHRFGGKLPDNVAIPDGAVLHALLCMDTTQCAALQGLASPTLPLVYPFQHDGGRIVYHWNDQKLRVDEVTPARAVNDWPYDDFPDILPQRTLGSSPAFDMDREDFEDLVCQGVCEDSDEKVIVVIPPCADYGVSLWGEHGDAERVQCVFVYDPATGRVTAESQCS